MHHIAYICLVDAHPKGDGTDHYTGAALQPKTTYSIILHQAADEGSPRGCSTGLETGIYCFTPRIGMALLGTRQTETE